MITHSNSTKQLAKRRCYNHFVLVEVLLSRLNALQHGFPVSIQTYTKKDGTMCNAYMHISQANNVRFFAFFPFSLWNNNVKNSSKSSFYLLDFFLRKISWASFITSQIRSIYTLLHIMLYTWNMQYLLINFLRNIRFLFTIRNLNVVKVFCVFGHSADALCTFTVSKYRFKIK